MSSNSSREFNDGYILIRVSDTPDQMKWKLPELYHHSVTGTIYRWQVAFDGFVLERIYGTLNAPQYTNVEIETNTSGRSINDQAFLQAKTLYKNKIYEGYQTADSNEPPHVTGMKGYPYKGPCDLINPPCVASFKFNGIRVLAQHLGAKNISLRSYKNRPFDHLELIKKQVLTLIPYLPQYATLDGEAYRHGMEFSEITSAVKTVDTLHPKIHLIQFHIFDIYYDANPPIEYRYNLLKKAFEACKADGCDISNLILAKHWYVYTHDVVMEHFKQALQLGYEGLVIRRGSKNCTEGSPNWKMSQYKWGRSRRVLKLKEFHDEEGVVIRVESATGKEKDLAMLILQDKFGFEVPIRMGTNEQRKEWFDNPWIIIGKEVTFKHVGRHHESNIAIQPTGVCVRDYE